MSIFGALALSLGPLGVYGLLSYLVSQLAFREPAVAVYVLVLPDEGRPLKEPPLCASPRVTLAVDPCGDLNQALSIRSSVVPFGRRVHVKGFR